MGGGERRYVWQACRRQLVHGGFMICGCAMRSYLAYLHLLFDRFIFYFVVRCYA